MGISFTKLILLFLVVFFIMNTLFPPLRDTLYAGLVNLFAETSPLFTHVVFQLLVVRKTAFSESKTFKGPKRWKTEGAKPGL